MFKENNETANPLNDAVSNFKREVSPKLPLNRHWNRLRQYNIYIYIAPEKYLERPKFFQNEKNLHLEQIGKRFCSKYGPTKLNQYSNF